MLTIWQTRRILDYMKNNTSVKPQCVQSSLDDYDLCQYSSSVSLLEQHFSCVVCLTRTLCPSLYYCCSEAHKICEEIDSLQRPFVLCDENLDRRRQDIKEKERKSIYLPDHFACSLLNPQRGFQKTRGEKEKGVSHGMRSLITEVRDEKVLLLSASLLSRLSMSQLIKPCSLNHRGQPGFIIFKADISS